MLFGEFKHAVDAKNRLFIPAKFREQLGESFVVVRSSDHGEKFLSVYSMEMWQAFCERMREQSSTELRGLNRYLGRASIEATPDSQGRILLTGALIEHAGIGKTAVVVGCNRYAEIWSEEAYNRVAEAEDDDAYEQQMIACGL